MNELENIIQKNNKSRIDFIDEWTEFMKNNSNETWSTEHNRLINSLID